MDSTNDTINVLIRHFDAMGWPLHMNRSKLFSRYSMTSNDGFPGWNIVEIERHRPILGTSYTPGLGMDAFETYYILYAVHVQTLEVKELPERRGNIDIDISGIVSSELNFERFSLSVEPIDQHCYMIKENVSNDQQVISSITEAKIFCELLLDSRVDYFNDTLYRELANLQLDEKQLEQLISDYSETMKKALLEKVDDAWRSRDTEE